MRAHRLLAGAALFTVLAAVFAAYLRPDFMFTLAGQIWACF